MRGILASLAVITSMVIANSAWSQTRGNEQLVTNPEQVKRILAALDDGVWVADGSAADTHVYVKYSTTCGYSKKLFEDTRALPNRPQFRWLTDAAEGYGAEMVVTKRTVESIRDAFAGKYAAPPDAATASRAMNINHLLIGSLPELSNSGYPTLIYKTAQGLRITSGVPANLQTFMSSVQSRPDRAAYQPASLRWLSEPVVMTPSKRLREYFNRSTTSVPVRIEPYLDAPVLTELSKGRGYSQVDAVANGEWIRVVLMTRGNSNAYGYIYAPLEINLANLEFTVQPANGAVKTSSRGLEIRSHPTMDAPVIDRPGPGLQIKKTGEVVLEGRNWVEVLVYTDGTKGYIAQ